MCSSLASSAERVEPFDVMFSFLHVAGKISHLYFSIAVDSKTLEYGCRMVHAGFPISVVLRLEDSHIPTFRFLSGFYCRTVKINFSCTALSHRRR